MDRIENINSSACPSPDISAYIDGELSPADEIRLEMHIAGCRLCADDLNLQKNFLNALDYSLDEKAELELPKNFTKSVVANAESRVSGLRRPHERRNAALICIALVVVSVFALGSSTERTLGAITTVVDKVVAVVESVGHLAYDIALGSAIVFRTLASKFVFDSGAAVVSFLLIFILSLYLFSRLLVRFHRT